MSTKLLFKNKKLNTDRHCFNLFFHLKQNAVIAELSEYIQNNPADAENVEKAIDYLDACRQLFERGILSHEKITSEQSSVLQHMSVGMPSSLVGLTMPGRKVKFCGFSLTFNRDL